MSGSGALREYASIVVVGGGCYGSYYVRQLLRARTAGRLSFDRLIVVDRNADCAVARAWGHEAAIEIVQSDWGAFFDEYLGAARAGSAPNRDAIVPSPLMPHLMFDWLVRRARERWPQRAVERRPLERPPNVPWQRALPSGTHVVSFAEWLCPVNCIEPAMCPAIKAPRTWTMPVALREYVHGQEPGDSLPLAGPIIFHCEHRAFGVGMFDTQVVLDADALVARAAASDAANVLVGTVSHCHGALDVLHVGRGHAA
ncbi:MAG TPA: hypothetical protein VJ650_01505 [Gemmatimonadaceae bacterium]|nr:hypothetical protein [Gemmatimonadaceae bacterium]